MSDTAAKEHAWAGFVMGVVAAFETVGWPQGLDRDLARRHAHTAYFAVNGGAFNPLSLWEMHAFARDLQDQLADAIRAEHLATSQPADPAPKGDG